MAESTTEKDHMLGDAYGNDPAYHQIKGERFVCSAPPTAKCRTNPTCECEQWCCCDDPESVAEHAEDNGHCCMTTVRAGQGCWMEPHVNAVGLPDSYDPNAMTVLNYEADDPTWPDGPVACDWEDEYVVWRYALAGADFAALLNTPPGSQSGGEPS